ncbi:MAG TPA: BTAD domain-containing putative transcriptional regulator, partial [Actinomycetota bacterium]|nr:BTAD domain-containing putative transcriptional regulator [Actinomycetota bacterium]
MPDILDRAANDSLTLERAGMEFRILGSMEVVVGDRRVELPSGRARALLALLILDAGQPIVAERLIDELWGEQPPETAATVVQGLVSRLRKALEPNRARGAPGEIIETVGSGYRLAIDASAVDAHQFTRLVDQSRAASPEGRVASLSTALGLWRGPALADFAYEPFAQRAIAVLDETRVEAIELRFEAELALGRDSALISDLEVAIAAHPFRERLRGFLMVALYRAGRQAEALDVYRATRAFLLDEMGLEPGRTLRELEDAILRQDPTLEFEGTPARARVEDSSWLPHERRQVTVVVVDVAPEADRDVDAEAVMRAGDRAATVGSDVLGRYGGRVERSPGDRLVAFFGFPVAHEDDTLLAVNAALDLRTAVHRLNDGSGTGAGKYRARIGLDTGEVIVGPGSSLADAVRGPVVSAADRLQHAAPDAEILVGPGAQRLLRGAVIMAPVEITSDRSIEAWRVLEVVTQAPAIPRTFDAPMIGRQSELTKLRSAFRRARRTGRGVPVTIIGDAGIGKSRLAREVIATLGDEVRTVTLRCPPPGDAIGFYPVRQAVGEAAGIHGWRGLHDLLAEAQDGASAVPAIADTIALRSPPASAAELLAPLRLLFETLARQHPLVIVVEDLHWADASFHEATEGLARGADGPILLLCLARPDAFDDRQPLGETVTLEPLDSGDIARLTIERAGSFAERSLRRIVDLSHGNPLFAEQLVATLDDGDLDTIPTTLAGLLSLRLDSLGPAERDVLRVASIAGVDVEIRVVEALLPNEARPFLDRHLTTLERRRLIERIGSDAFRFAHPLIQMATYQTMTRDDRESL